MRIFEGGIFIALAMSAHLGVLGLQNETGQQSAGASGIASITLQGSTASIEAVVEDWKRPPEISEQTDLQEPPVVETPPEDVAELPPVPDVQQPDAIPPAQRSAALPTQIPDALPLPPVSTAPAELETTQEIEASPVAIQPETPARPTPPLRSAMLLKPSEMEKLPDIAPPPIEYHALKQSSRPMPRQKTPPPAKAPPKVTPKPPVPKAARNSAAAPAQAKVRAQGAGNGATSGNTGRAAASTGNSNQKAKLIATWGSQIQRAVQRKLVYPRKARERRMTGTTLVKLTINASGQLLAKSVAKSSGNRVLDQAALATISRVGRFGRAPEGLRGNSFTFRIPIRFRIK